jgi:hypothetical protein
MYALVRLSCEHRLRGTRGQPLVKRIELLLERGTVRVQDNEGLERAVGSPSGRGRHPGVAGPAGNVGFLGGIGCLA